MPAPMTTACAEGGRSLTIGDPNRGGRGLRNDDRTSRVQGPRPGTVPPPTVSRDHVPRRVPAGHVHGRGAWTVPGEVRLLGTGRGTVILTAAWRPRFRLLSRPLRARASRRAPTARRERAHD